MANKGAEFIYIAQKMRLLKQKKKNITEIK